MKTFKDRLIKKVSALMLVAIMVLLIPLCAAVMVQWGDNAGVQTQEGPALVVAKKEIGPTQININTGKVRKESMRPMRWQLCAQVDNQVGCFDVSEYQYGKIEKGARIHITYTVGHLTGDLHIKSFRN